MLSLLSRAVRAERPERPARPPVRRPVSRPAMMREPAPLAGWSDSSLELKRGVDVVEFGGERGAALFREIFGAAVRAAG